MTNEFRINAGKYRQVVTFQKLTEVQNGYGETSKQLASNWEDAFQARVSILPVTGKEIIAREEDKGEITHRIYMRYQSGVDSTMRILFGSRIFEIVSPPINFTEQNKEIQLLVKEIENPPSEALVSGPIPPPPPPPPPPPIKVRYVRDYIAGNTENGYNYWVELRVVNKSYVNVAKGIVPTTDQGITTTSVLAHLTDEDLTLNTSINSTVTNTLQYMQLDLGTVYDDIAYIQVWHYYVRQRSYHNHYVDVSEDGVNWTRLHNSDETGEIVETSAGIVVQVNPM